MMECLYCGNAHDVRGLCRARRVSRRRFLFAAGVTFAAAAAAPFAITKTAGFTIERTIRWPRASYPDGEALDTFFGLYALGGDDSWRSPYLGFTRELTIVEAVKTWPTYQDVERQDFRR